MKCRGFSFDFPIYAIVAKETVSMDGDVVALDDDIRFVAPTGMGGVRGLALFTTAERATEFHREYPSHQELTLFNIPDINSFARLLHRAEGLYDDVLFDPNPQFQVPGSRLLSFPELLRAVTQELGHQEYPSDH